MTDPSTGSSSPHRVRPHASERFANREEVIDLDQAAENLLREPGAGQHGHRQIALFHHGPATFALYCFEPGATLDDHVVDGPVTIQVLSGHLSVRTESQEHDLHAGTLLRLARGVKHDLRAHEATRILLTLCVEGPNSHT